MANVNSKTASRLASVQALYQFEINGRLDSAEELVKIIQNSYTSKDFKEVFEIPKNISLKLHNNYLKELIFCTIENLAKLDEIITSHLTGEWKYSNLHMSLVALLRVGIAEIIYFPETPYKVIINEFTDIGASLAKASEISFINSLLNTISIEYRNEQQSSK